MAETAKKPVKKSNQNKNIIFGLCAALIAVVIIIVVIVLATRGNGSTNANYFVSDGTKYVLNLGAEDLIVEDESITPVAAHIVYYYNGDTVTGVKAYYEFADAATAGKAHTFYSEANNGTYKDIALDGVYVVMTSNESDYEGLTAADVKQQIEFIETLKTQSQNQNQTTEETTEEVVEETTE